MTKQLPFYLENPCKNFLLLNLSRVLKTGNASYRISSANTVICYEVFLAINTRYEGHSANPKTEWTFSALHPSGPALSRTLQRKSTDPEIKACL